MAGERADGDRPMTVERWLVLRVLAIGGAARTPDHEVRRIASLPVRACSGLLDELEAEGVLAGERTEDGSEYWLTGDGVELTKRAVVSDPRPWTLPCKVSGRFHRARARARAYDLAVAAAFDDAWRAAKVVRDKDAHASRAAGYTTMAHGEADDRAVNDAIDRAFDLVQGEHRIRHPDRDDATFRGLDGLRNLRDVQDRAEQTRAGIAAVEPPSVPDVWSFLTPLIGAVVGAVYDRYALRRALAEEGRYDVFKKRHRALLMVIQYIHPRYEIWDFTDDYLPRPGDVITGDIYNLLNALEKVRALYTTAG